MTDAKINLPTYFKGRFCEGAFLAVAIPYLAFCAFSAVWWTVNFVPGHLMMSLAFMLFIPAMPLAEYIFGMRFGPLFSVLVLLIAVGGILGSPFSLYSIIPSFDAILHTLSGVVFAALGFALCESLLGRADTGRRFAGALTFAAAFSLGIAVLWELWEFSGMLLLGMETADDTLVNSFTTFIFGGRSEPTVLDGILKTVIHLEDGSSIVVDGYLDIGYMDTVLDMVVCTLGALAFTITAILSRLLFPRVNEMLIPAVSYGEKGVVGAASAAASADFAASIGVHSAAAIECDAETSGTENEACREEDAGYHDGAADCRDKTAENCNEALDGATV